MFIELVYVLIGLGVAFACMMFYRRGLKDGQSAKQGKTPKPFVQSKPADEIQEEYAKRADMYLSYDPYNPPKGDE